MLRHIFAASFALALLPAAGAELREQLLQYSRIEVAPLKNRVGENLEKATVEDLHQRIVDRINDAKVALVAAPTETAFPKRSEESDEQLFYPGTGAAEDAKTIILFTEVITFNKGSRAKRYLAGGGSGRAELRGNCYLLDKRTGKQLYHFQTFGETNWGLLGGGGDKTSKGFAGRIVSFLQGKY